MIVLTTPEPTVRPPSREFSMVFSRVFNVFSGFLYTEIMGFLCIIYIIQSSWHRFGTDNSFVTHFLQKQITYAKIYFQIFLNLSKCNLHLFL